MKYCSKAAQALCAYRKYCEPDALFEDDSECDIFNQYIANRALTDADDFSQSVTTPVITVADHIRAMSDEELAKIITCPYDNALESCVPGSNCMVPKWVSVSERLPEEERRYLCNVKSFAFPGRTYINILRYDKYGFCEGNIYTDDVIHWMPLPEPPSTEGVE